MRIFSPLTVIPAGCRQRSPLKAGITLLVGISLFFLNTCYSTIEYYKRGEGYASEKINAEVNDALDCNGANAGKTYCDDSRTNREKKYKGPVKTQVNTIAEEPPMLPNDPEWMENKKKAATVPEAIPNTLPKGTDEMFIQPLAPEKQEVIKSEEKTIIEKPAVKKKPQKKKAKKPAKKTGHKKKIVKKSAKPKPENPVNGGAGGGSGTDNPTASGNDSGVINTPLLPRATDNMLEPEKITP